MEVALVVGHLERVVARLAIVVELDDVVVFGELGRERTVCKVTGAAERTSVEIAIESQVAPQLAGVADGDDVVFGQLILDVKL